MKGQYISMMGAKIKKTEHTKLVRMGQNWKSPRLVETHSAISPAGKGWTVSCRAQHTPSI